MKSTTVARNYAQALFLAAEAHGAAEIEQYGRLMEALAASGQMRAHWTIDEATDALGALTSYATYERLRRAPRTPEQVEAVLAKLVVSIVSRSPNGSPSGHA